jgi:hypothetical protein
MAQEIIKPNSQQIIEDLEEIDFILSKKIEEKQNGTKEKWTDSS